MSWYTVLMLLALAIVPLTLGKAQQAQAPVYIWLEPEWFEGVKGGFGYWSGPDAMKATGSWGIAGPGISAEFSQGGESGWNSIGAAPAETNAECRRQITVPRAGQYRVWVRYYDHREKTEPFTVRLEQDGKAVAGELGMQGVVPPNDEYMLYWGFAFGWGVVEGTLQAGPATLRLIIDKPGEGWRQVDAILITDDLNYTPYGREKPPFAYFDAFNLRSPAPLARASDLKAGAGWTRPPLAGRDFAMWAAASTKREWWDKQEIDKLSLYDVYFEFSPPRDIAKQFQEQFAGRKDLPLITWKGLLPGFHLGEVPDFSPETPARQWFERTKTPFYIMTNYANPNYSEQAGPATYQALTGPLKDQFLGFIHGEALGTGNGPTHPHEKLATDRRGHIDALGARWKQEQAKGWSAYFKTPVADDIYSLSIPCLSVHSTAYAHLFHEIGLKTVGYELDATNAHTAMRIAFERGAARQYGGRWINYASSNFGDACNYFFQNPVVPRGAGGWFHSKYAITDGVSAVWYRKFYYLNYLGGASAIYWEQGLGNQWFKPGPGNHPVQFTPFGRATEDFMAFTDRLPDRGEPYTPVAFLLNYGHGYEPVSYDCKQLSYFEEGPQDRELRELFNVAWYPAVVDESRPIAPDHQSLASGTYGDIFDVLVDRPNRLQAINDYPIVWVAGDAELGGQNARVLEEYVQRGGTLVVNINAAMGALPESLVGVRFTRGVPRLSSTWTPAGGAAMPCTPYRAIPIQVSQGTQVLATGEGGVPLITSSDRGQGRVILTTIPGMMGLDEVAHPALAYLMNGLTQNLLPVEVLVNGKRPEGEIGYSLNRTKDGWLVTLVNNRGVDKTQSGVARVDRRAYADVTLRTGLNVRAVREYTQPRELTMNNGQVTVRVHPGDVQVVGFQF